MGSFDHHGRHGAAQLSAPALSAPAADHVRPGRLCGGRPDLVPDFPAGCAALLDLRGHSQLCRLRFRDGFRLHHHRRQHSDRRGGPAQGASVLAQLHPLAGRHGRAGVSAGHYPLHRRFRRQHAHHARRIPRPAGEQAGAPDLPQRSDRLHHLHRHDRPADHSDAAGRRIAL